MELARPSLPRAGVRGAERWDKLALSRKNRARVPPGLGGSPQPGVGVQEGPGWVGSVGGLSAESKGVKQV